MDLNYGRELRGSARMYGTAVKEEPSASQLEAARLGFTQMLRRKRFSARFIEANAEDLLARARFEYTRALHRGAEIHSPAGWLINCAWRRTQNLLEAQGSEPAFVSTEKAGAIVDEQSPSPEQAALEGERARRIEVAMEQLSNDQRTLIELSYFEGMSVREAGRFLGWHSSRAQRCHEAALRALREALGVSDVEELAIEIGLAAWVSLAGGRAVGVSVPGGLEALADAGGRTAGGLWSRAQELARRVVLGGGGGEPSSAIAAGGVARTAGVCGAAAAACLASGVVGPGVGGVAIVTGGGAHREQPKLEQRAGPVAAPEESGPAIEEVPTNPATSSRPSAGKFATTGARGHKPVGEAGESTQEAKSPEGQAEAEFSPFGGGSTESAAPSAAPAEVPTRIASGAPSAESSAGDGSAGQEFGAFR